MLDSILASARSNEDVRVQANAATDGDGLISNDKIRIAVVGVGGGGCNTINRMMKNNIQSAQTIAINTDSLHLRSMSAHKKVLIGGTITKGLGAGGFPEVAEKAALASKNHPRAGGQADRSADAQCLAGASRHPLPSCCRSPRSSGRNFRCG